jgi:hypothetical protein
MIIYLLNFSNEIHDFLCFPFLKYEQMQFVIMVEVIIIILVI